MLGNIFIILIMLIFCVAFLTAFFIFRKDQPVLAYYLLFLLIVLLAFGCKIICLMLTYTNLPGTNATNQERYISLNARVENHMYSIVSKNILIEEVQDWNEDFATIQANKESKWIAIFHPESLEGLDRIDLSKIN